MNTGKLSPDGETHAASNRSLERGIALLRAFGAGAALLGTSDLVERTGLPKATVSRLTQTLVHAGYLEHDAARRAYRLSVSVLSLAHSFRTGSTVLKAAAPLIAETVERLHVNVGLAGPDLTEMVYLESVRFNSQLSLRQVVSGQRVPMELTSLGRAYLAKQAEPERSALMALFKQRRQNGWSKILRDIESAIHSIRTRGFCVASWQPEVIAASTPLIVPGHGMLILNFSARTQEDAEAFALRLSGELLSLRDKIARDCEQLDG